MFYLEMQASVTCCGEGCEDAPVAIVVRAVSEAGEPHSLSAVADLVGCHAGKRLRSHQYLHPFSVLASILATQTGALSLSL